jgi:exodeoxyribonuclease VII large subunit
VKNERNADYLSVTEFNNYVKGTLEGEPFLSHVCVRGEISSYKEYPSAVYFDIKDSKSVLSCMMWSDYAMRLTFQPKQGDDVLVEGRIGVYAPRGRYQLMASSISLFGAGAELLKLQELKKKLEREGLFDASRKKPIPAFPSKIGMIVGDGSAAEADLLRNMWRRWPLADLYVFPSLVQGKEAPNSLRKALSLAEGYPLDVLIIARGGGSNEDLSAFNDEKLVREVAACPIPTISAVGHEIDFTLVDFAADCRVSTPTGAAERATPLVDDILQSLDEAKGSLDYAMNGKIKTLSDKLASLSSRPFFADPTRIYDRSLEKVGNLKIRLDSRMASILSIDKEKVAGLSNHLRALDPKGVLKRGYSITRTPGGKVIVSKSDVAVGDTLLTNVSDGIIESKVQRK